MTCNNCGKPINRGKWCSDKCRMAYARAFNGELAPVHNPNKPSPEHKVEQDDWTNKETKTQEEIEAHYTLANFPMPKYYSSGGGGAGSLSPYRMSDPRYKAYEIK